MMNEAPPPGGFGSGQPLRPNTETTSPVPPPEFERNRTGWVRALQVITWLVLLFSSGPMVWAGEITSTSLHETNCMHPGDASTTRDRLITFGVLLLIYLVFAGPPAYLLIARKSALSVYIAACITGAALFVSFAEFLVFLFMQACLE